MTTPTITPTPSVVQLTTTITSSWVGGFGSTLTIVNTNTYPINVFYLTFTSSSTAITWTSHFTLSAKINNVITLKLNAPVILQPNVPFVENFGGTMTTTTTLSPSALTSMFSFVQLDPPVVPVDPSVRGNFGSKNYTPYVDILAYPEIDIVSIAKNTGHYFYTWAFIVNNNLKPSWGGVIDLTQRYFIPQLNELRQLGGDVIISLGGANGQELAQSITSIPALVSAYQSIIDLYSLKWIDFDIEGGATADKTSVDRRNDALKIIQQNNPSLRTSYCLPVLPTGLTGDGVYVLQSAKTRGVKIDVLGIMSMDFGDSAWDPKKGTMAQACIQSAQATQTQANAVGFSVGTTIRIIPMIGVNDVSTEIFTLADAQTLVDWCKTTSWVSGLSNWSVNRDTAGNVKTYADNASSSIKQNNYDFMSIFKTFQSAGGSSGPTGMTGMTGSSSGSTSPTGMTGSSSGSTGPTGMTGTKKSVVIKFDLLGDVASNINIVIS